MKTVQRVEETKVSINPSADGVYLFATWIYILWETEWSYGLYHQDTHYIWRLQRQHH